MTLWQEPIMTPTPRWVFGCVCLVNDSFEKSTYNYYFEDFIPWILWLLIAWKVEKFKSVETEYFSILGSCFDFRASWLVWCFKKFRSYIESYLFRWILKMMTFILTVVCLENHCGITALLLLKGTGSSLDVSWPLGVGFDCLIGSLLRLGSEKPVLSPRRKLRSSDLESLGKWSIL